MEKLLRGFPGKPSHPPLTDASIGAYTVGIATLIAGALGLEEEQMAHAALLGLSLGLLLAVPTALTGLADWVGLPPGSPARRTATVHLVAMAAATSLFALTWLAQLDGYRDGYVDTLALVLGLAGGALLAAGGYVGGALAYVYGVRVLKQPDTSVADALVPGRAGHDMSALPGDEADGAASRPTASGREGTGRP